MDPDNMKFRLEDLTVDSVLRDCGISPAEAKQMPPNLVKLFVEDFIPTEEDIRQPLSEEQLKELCLRVPCRVLMYRWNPVQDYARRFEREGRLQRWEPVKRQKLLAKAVNRYRSEAVYTEDEMRPQQEREWCERKKMNLMRLDLWDYDREQEAAQQKKQQPKQQRRSTVDGTKSTPRKQFCKRRKTMTIELDSESSVDMHYSNASSSTNISAASTVVNQANVMTRLHAPQQTRDIDSDQADRRYIAQFVGLQESAESAATAVNVDLLRMRQLQIQDELEKKALETSQLIEILAGSTQDSAEYIDVGNEEQHATLYKAANGIDENANVGAVAIVETQPSQFVLLTQEQLQPHMASAPLTQEENVLAKLDGMQDLMNINTESMSITETPLDSEYVYSEGTELFSEENTPPYIDFDNHISLTSTQSPTQPELCN